MLLLFFAVLSVALVAGPFLSLAQPPPPTLAQCIPGTDPWSFNSIQQSPCEVAADLAGICTHGFNIPPLVLPNVFYLGPNAGSSTDCVCSTVYYSLLSACALCQNFPDIRSWSEYKTNCTTVFITVFKDPIPTNTRVPHYAYLDVTTADIFNATLAQSAGGAESTNIPTPTSSPLAATSVSPGSTTVTHHRHTGAIAGGVVGGIVGFTLLVVLLSTLYRKMKARRPTGTYDPPLATDMQSIQPEPINPPLKLYNPNDPSTFPEPINRVPTPTPRSTGNVYTGRPEV